MSQSQFSAQAKPTEFLGLCQAINPSQYLTLADTETYRITKIEKSPLRSSSPTIPQTAEVTTDPIRVPKCHMHTALNPPRDGDDATVLGSCANEISTPGKASDRNKPIPL